MDCHAKISHKQSETVQQLSSWLSLKPGRTGEKACSNVQRSFWRLTSSNLPWNHYEDSTSMTMTKNDQADILPLEFWFQSHNGEVIPGFHCRWFMLHFFLQMWSYALEKCKLETCQRNDSGKRTPQVQFHFYIIVHSSAKFNSGFGLYVLLRSLQDILGWWLGWLWSILRNLWLAGE